jgi:hypothetical protein
MTRNSSRRTRLLSWRYLRWAIALPTLPMAWWACISHPLTQPVPEPEQQTDIYISVAPIRKLDLVFMVDNSPSMAPKVEKMNAQFKKLIVALQDPSDGTYPDLRVALIDSDLGTGGAYSSGSCGSNQSNGQNAYGDLGNFQMRNVVTKADGTTVNCGMSSNDSLWIEYAKGVPLNYPANKDINLIFQCLASNLGTIGCGEEHQLQAFEFALVAQNLHKDQNGGLQNTFLRQEAYLGLVFLSDEDDCSAATNDGMFGDKTDLRGESASLRCATRGHQCTGTGKLTDNGPGYPTNAKFETDFTNCSARTDACPNQTDGESTTDTSVPTTCSPLKSVKNLANEIKSLKGDEYAEKILVAGIFGWPRKGSDGKPDFTKAEKYKIDLIPNPNTLDTAHPEYYDYWPVCYDPNHLPKSSGFDQEAWGWGAEGGLRLSAFIDEFGEKNGLKYSICEADFTDAMKGIGDTLAKRLQNLCVDAKLYDTDLDPNNATLADLKADCRVVYRRPETDATTGKIVYKEDALSMPKCAQGATNGNVEKDCWQLSIDKTKCPVNGQLITVLRTAKEIADGPLTEGTKVGMQCRTCPDDLTALDEKSQSYQACSYAAF